MTNELIYGASPYGYLTMVEPAALQRAEVGIRAVLAARTVGEACGLDAPGVEDDELDDEVYDVREIGAVQDGDWPPNVGMLALETLPGEVRRCMTREHSMVGQEWMELSEEDESRVVERVRALGYTVRRDDEAIAAFDSILDR